jgi:hypothetical protein
VLLILETLKYVVIAGFSALKAILLGIVVFGLLLALLLPGIIVLRRVLNKKISRFKSDTSALVRYGGPDAAIDER